MRMTWRQWLASFWRPKAAPPVTARRPVTRRQDLTWQLVHVAPPPLPEWAGHATATARVRARTKSEARARFKALMYLGRKARLPLGFAVVLAYAVPRGTGARSSPAA